LETIIRRKLAPWPCILCWRQKQLLSKTVLAYTLRYGPIEPEFGKLAARVLGHSEREERKDLPVCALRKAINVPSTSLAEEGKANAKSVERLMTERSIGEDEPGDERPEP
jgi:hypothetical protein